MRALGLCELRLGVESGHGFTQTQESFPVTLGLHFLECSDRPEDGHKAGKIQSRDPGLGSKRGSWAGLLGDDLMSQGFPSLSN